MSLTTFNSAMTTAGFDSSSTKISKANLKTILNEISNGIWGGTGTKIGLTKIYENQDPNEVAGTATYGIDYTVYYCMSYSIIRNVY